MKSIQERLRVCPIGAECEFKCPCSTKREAANVIDELVEILEEAKEAIENIWQDRPTQYVKEQNSVRKIKAALAAIKGGDPLPEPPDE